MARSVNKVILVGNLGQDPDIRQTPQGSAVASLSLATSENFKDKNGNWQDATEWHRVTLWNYLAETAAKNLKKGSKVYIEGKLQTRSYEKDGITRFVTEINASHLVLLDPSSNSGNYEAGGYSGGGSSYSESKPSNKVSEDDLMSDGDDDDIPF